MTYLSAPGVLKSQDAGAMTTLIVVGGWRYPTIGHEHETKAGWLMSDIQIGPPKHFRCIHA